MEDSHLDEESLRKRHFLQHHNFLMPQKSNRLTNNVKLIFSVGDALHMEFLIIIHQDKYNR